MAKLDYQVRITNMAQGKGSRVLTITQSKLKDYIEMLALECNKKFRRNRSQEVDHLPLLCVWDVASSGEEFIFDSIDDLPKKTIYNTKGEPVLIILPEKERETVKVTTLSNKLINSNKK